MLQLKKILNYFFLLLFTLSVMAALSLSAPKSYADCPPPYISLSATTNGNVVNFRFGQTAPNMAVLFIRKVGVSAPYRTVDVGNRSGYTTTLPDGNYTAAIAYTICQISNDAPFNAGSATTSYILREPTINNYDVTFNFSPVPANSKLWIYQNGGSLRDHFDLYTSQSSQDWTGTDGGYYAYITDQSGTKITNEVSFGLPSTSSPPGSVECTDFLGCTNIPHLIPGFGDNTFAVDLIHNVLPIAIGIGAFVSVIMIILSGAQFVMSSGDPESAAKARGRLTYAIIGFALLALAFGITKVIDVYFLKSQLF